ncbi:MAG: hypothetical protein WD045_08925 [Pirellulaceae bacterium]
MRRRSLDTQYAAEGQLNRWLPDGVRFGFFFGSGLGLMSGTAVSIVVGQNLLWQTGGLAAGSVLGIAAGALLGLYKSRRMVYRAAMSR